MVTRSGICFDGMDIDNYIQTLIPTINAVLHMDYNIYPVCDSNPLFEKVRNVGNLLNKRYTGYK